MSVNQTQDFRIARIRHLAGLLDSLVVRGRASIEEMELVDPASQRFTAPPDEAAWEAASLPVEWGEKQAYAWFRGRIEVPKDWPTVGEEVAYRLHVDIEPRYLEYAADDNFNAGPEGIVFVNGENIGAIDKQHHHATISAKPGAMLQVALVMFAARCQCRHRLTNFAVERIDQPTWSLRHDLMTVIEVAERMEDGSLSRERLIDAVEQVLAELDLREIHHRLAPPEVRRDPDHRGFYASVPAARAMFGKVMKTIAQPSDRPRVSCVGHAHIDLAWLWPYDVTRDKCVRTFATQCRLLEQYPDWIFNQSSPQAYAWVKRDAPELFEKIKKQIKAGRWEADGATWVEMDTNVPSGESLVRQLLYGKRFFQEELGVDSRMLWLPDVFGYSAALPQILRLAGVDGFVTSKISWSQFNEFPHDTFRWRGIDGTEIVTHYITTPVGHVEWAASTWLRTYNATIPVKDVLETARTYKQKHLGINPLLTFGHGDGGGGPTEIILEPMQRLANWELPGDVPGVHFEKAGDLIKRIAEQAEDLPRWDGELYLEYHRGTLTSQAWLKRANRQCEIALRDAEWLAVLAGPLGFQMDRAVMDAAWQDLLLSQFHDVLPGSSVHEVYEVTRPMLKQVHASATEQQQIALQQLGAQIDTESMSKPLLLVNTHAWERTGPIQLPDKSWRDDLTLPAGGWAAIDLDHATAVDHDQVPLTISPDGLRLTNQYWHIELDENGRIVQLYDQRQKRDVIARGALANHWQVYLDKPTKYSAWEIEADFERYPLPSPELQSIEVVELGPVRSAIELVWLMPETQPDGKTDPSRQSRIWQRIAIYARTPRIDFETMIDWYEHDTLLKVAFPVDLRTTQAAYEIQFGHIHRPTHVNTSWDEAKFECCGHRWVDLAEHGYGVALLNDSKYGFDIRENVIRMTCLKSPQKPDATADQGRHEFRYALLPHADSFQAAGVVRAAAEFNAPPLFSELNPSEGKLPQTVRGFALEGEAIVLDTLKPAEDGKGYIARLYESHGSHARATLLTPSQLKSAELVDLLEASKPDKFGTITDQGDDTVKVHLKPFEVVSLRLIMK